jgi:hypothetical protein
MAGRVLVTNPGRWGRRGCTTAGTRVAGTRPVMTGSHDGEKEFGSFRGLS